MEVNEYADLTEEEIQSSLTGLRIPEKKINPADLKNNLFNIYVKLT